MFLVTGGLVFCWDRIAVDFLCFRPGGQTHGMPGSSGPGIVETEEAKGPQGRHNLNPPTRI
jgi:hypothetical protein